MDGADGGTRNVYDTYPNQIAMNGRDQGSLMLQIKQDIPNPAKLRSKKTYIQSQANIETANGAVTLNDLKVQAKRLYSNWVIEKKQDESAERK